MHDVTRDLNASEMVSLAERILAGDRGAETELFDHFSPRIYALLCARTHDRETSRDLLHDALIALLRALRQGQIREPEKLVGFALGIARNTAQSYIRSGMRKREVPLADSAPATAQSRIEAEERDRYVARALSELDSTDREILRLTLVDGHKPGAISNILGINSGAVRQRKRRATRKVSDYLKNVYQTRSQTAGDPPHEG